VWESFSMQVSSGHLHACLVRVRVRGPKTATKFGPIGPNLGGSKFGMTNPISIDLVTSH
jgi:hypothetical protein